MTEILYLANIEYSKSSGIYKKIEWQCLSMSTIRTVTLICKCNRQLVKIFFLNGEITSIEAIEASDSVKSLLFVAKKLFESKKYEILYFRLTLRPTVKQVFLFKTVVNLGGKIIYEIPTYPYFKEQVSGGKVKILTFFKMLYDKVIFEISYKYIYLIPIILGNSKVKLKSKFFEITNGVSIGSIPLSYLERMKSDDFSNLNLIGVGTFANYHGYERLINAIGEYVEVEDHLVNIHFHIVGDGSLLNGLKVQVKRLSLEKYVHFYGPLFGKELDEIFENADMGVGALALYKRGADIDTTLKVVEYICRGLPVISSGRVASIDNKGIILHVGNDNSPIDLLKLIDFVRNYKRNVDVENIKSNRLKFNWKNLMESILDATKG